MENNRLYNSIKNLLSGFLSKVLIVVLGFVVRTVFINVLGNVYLSVNGLYTNILSVLSLTELGFGTAMLYSMYEPLAKRDYKKLSALMELYKKVYRGVGFIVLILGLCILPFMKYIVKNPPEIGHLTFYYIIFLMDSVLSYWLFAYKRSVLIADQKEYVCTNYHNLMIIVRSFIQVMSLIIFKNFLIYLVIQVSSTIIENAVIAAEVNRKYPEIRRNTELLNKTEIVAIWKNVKALTLTKLGHVVLNSTDNIIISAFIGVSWIGTLSNFTLIVDAVTGFLCQIGSSISAGLGNYFIEKSKNQSYELFKRVEFINSWLYGFCMIALLILLNPFVELWLGARYTLSNEIVFALAVNFFVQGYMNTLWIFRSTLGLFTQGQYRPLIVAILNVALSIIFSFRWGVAGVLIATSVSRACVNLWYDPLLLHKYGFGKPVVPFFKKYVVRITLLGLIGGNMVYMARVVFRDGVSISMFIVMLFLTLIVPNVILFIAYHRTEEFQYFWQLGKHLLKKRL